MLQRVKHKVSEARANSDQCGDVKLFEHHYLQYPVGFRVSYLFWGEDNAKQHCVVHRSGEHSHRTCLRLQGLGLDFRVWV